MNTFGQYFIKYSSCMSSQFTNPANLLLRNHCPGDKVLQLLIGIVDTELLKAVHLQILQPEGTQRNCQVMFHNNKKKVWLDCCFDQSDLWQETDLKTIDVHNSYCTVHLSGTQPVVDLLQQPIKQH